MSKEDVGGGNEGEEKREEFVIKVGPQLMEVLTKLKKDVGKYGWDVLNVSNYEAGEILAKASIEKKLFVFL